MRIEASVLITLLKHRRVLTGELANSTGASYDVIKAVIDKYRDALNIVNEEIIVVDPLKIAIRLAEKNTSLRLISQLLDWRDFEVFSSRILYEFGYEVERGVKLTTPIRLEIDVYGVEETTGFAIAIDCKHWSSMTKTKLIEAANNHYERINKLLKYINSLKQKYRVIYKTKEILPLIITLLRPSLRVHGNVLIVSIEELPELLRSRHLVLDSFELKPIRLRHSF